MSGIGSVVGQTLLWFVSNALGNGEQTHGAALLAPWGLMVGESAGGGLARAPVAFRTPPDGAGGTLYRLLHHATVLTMSRLGYRSSPTHLTQLSIPLTLL